MKRFVVSIALLYITAASVPGQDDDRLIIRNADSLIGRSVEGEIVRELTGNVILEQRGVLVYCDRAVHYPGRNSAYLEGNVKVVDDTVTLLTDRGYYHGSERILEGEGSVYLNDGLSELTSNFGKYNLDSKIAEFWDEVFVDDPAGRIYADRLIHRRDEEFSTAFGNVRVIDRQRGTTVFGGYLEYDSRSGYSLMSESPVLVQIDSTESGVTDTLIVTGITMESVRDTVRLFHASGEVELMRSDLAAKGEHASYHIDQDHLSLTGDPILWYRNNQVVGDSIHVVLENRRLRTLEVFGRTFAISKNDERYPDRFNQLTGVELTMLFSDDELEKIEVREQATSVYYVFEDPDPNGLNHVSGDRIEVLFENGAVRELKITGGIEGKYYPENLVRGNESSYNLIGFIWRTDRPDLSVPSTRTITPQTEILRYE